MKSIMVINTPIRCDDCPCGHESCYVGIWCKLLKTNLPHYGKPDNCPLKPVPDKYEIDKSKCSDRFYEFEFEEGYNSCIDDIMEEIL